MGNYRPNLLGVMYFENPYPALEVGDSFFCVVPQILDSGEDAANGLIQLGYLYK